ncbi:tellurite resistance TerB family protein [Aquibium oceanicum]|uniref:Tellurite resistance protein TerB n=1 Tax=Aquibium oceanicum TaxID=1670800 RepID=A0A1L3SVP2_9HYPH|nr:tellurite resistance TerB family protein [Aquibium oceanicum]APH73450.1 Tellurite resistance protein TerB [Aquibium oceanicum]
MIQPANVQEALVHIMVAVSASDSNMTDRELAKMGTVVRTMPVFVDFEPESLLDVARRSHQVLQQDETLNDIVASIVEAIPARLRDTAYSVAVEIAAADRRVRPEELRILQILRGHLGIDTLTAAAIERAAVIRHRTLV